MSLTRFSAWRRRPALVAVSLAAVALALAVAVPLFLVAGASPERAGGDDRGAGRPAASAPHATDADGIARTKHGDVLVAAAGDIACEPGRATSPGGRSCQHRATADLLADLPLDAVLPLGDVQYESGELDGLQTVYGPTWGRLKAISHPAVGNHEYLTPDAAGYFTYFGKAAGDPGQGWYSYDLGSWHLIALNSECSHIGGCGEGSPQERWLKADLAAHPTACTLAYWHEPRFSSGKHGDKPALAALWRDLYDAGAEIVLSGHDHDYERFAPQDPDGALDRARGIRQFVVGTGGANHYHFETVKPNSEVRNGVTFGVLLLRLGHGRFQWRFQPVPGEEFTDSGTGRCH